MIDESGECIVVTIFNLADGKGVIIGDSVAIPEPFLTNVDFEFNSMVRINKWIICATFSLNTRIRIHINKQMIEKMFLKNQMLSFSFCYVNLRIDLFVTLIVEVFSFSEIQIQTYSC